MFLGFRKPIMKGGGLQSHCTHTQTTKGNWIKLNRVPTCGCVCGVAFGVLRGYFMDAIIGHVTLLGRNVKVA